MRLSIVAMLSAVACLHAADTLEVRADFGERLGPMRIERMSLGQGGLSAEPMWADRIPEIRALNPTLVRLFIQEYFDLLPERGKYHFDTLDRSVDTIRATGATPLMCICFKPRVLFPAIDQNVVLPNDWDEWERLITAMVAHYKERGVAGLHWEVANEPDIGEDGGCPYRFTPEAYVAYYRHTAGAVLAADSSARVGGPALASVRSPIFPALLGACAKEKLPLHFASWHIYSSDPRAVRGTVDFAKALIAKYPGLTPETILDEWNMDLMNPPSDARKAQWFLKKPSGDNYEQVLAKITTPSATSVVVDAGDFVLAAGTYRLVGVY